MKNLKDYLKIKNLKQVEIAQEIGVPPSAISLQINGWKMLPEKYLSHFCSYLGIDYQLFLTGIIKEEENDCTK